MTRSKRMQPILDLAERRQDEAARTVAVRAGELEQQQQRLQALRQYVDEYARAPVSTTTAVHPSLLANRQAFRERLDAAVTEQAGIVEYAHETCERVRQVLIDASRSKLVMEKLTATYVSQEQRAADRREQSVLDDLGARTIHRR